MSSSWTSSASASWRNAPVRRHEDVRQEITARIAASIRQQAESDSEGPAFSVSIVLATLDRPDQLRNCLASLRGHRSRHHAQIVVVDNDPDSGLTAPVVDAFPGVIYVAESRRGLAYRATPGSSGRPATSS